MLHRILLLTDRMAGHEVEERVAKAVKKLVAKAKANIRIVSPSGKTNWPKSPNKVVVPPLPHASLPAHLRVQACVEDWCSLQDRYVEDVLRHGLRLDWVSDFDGELQAPVPTYENSSTHCPHVRRLLRAAAEEGTLVAVSEDQLSCVSAPFTIDKKHAPREEEKRLILNLRSVHLWVLTGHSALPTLGIVLL